MDYSTLAACAPTDLSPLERDAHARDLWPRRTLGLVHGELPPAPAAVCFPGSEGEVLAVLRWAADRGVPVVPWGAGSGVCGGAEGRADGITLDLKRLRAIGPVDHENAVVRVGAGVIGQHLEDTLEAAGWATRHSPSSIWCSTVGGWAASRSAGQFSSCYGKFEDMLVAGRVVTSEGVFGVGSWADGEDLAPWVVGSEGALGVFSELLVRVVPVAPQRWLRGYRVASTEAAWEIMRSLLQSGPLPCALRLYDPVDTRIAGKGTATTARSGGASWLRGLQDVVESLPGVREHLLSLPLALPRLLNAIADRASGDCVLIAGWEGEPAATEARARAGHAAILAGGGVDLGPEPGEHWYAHRHEVSYKLAPIFERGGFADTMEVCALWSRLPELYRGVREALGRYGLVMAHFSHAYREGCSIYFTFAGRGDDAVYRAAWADALAAAAAAGGTVAHHHGVGQLKMEAAGRELAGLRSSFLALKARLDPAGILNPGRMFPDPGAASPPEPDAPPLGVDAVSLVATLPAHEPAAARDAELARQGFRLLFPTDGPVVDALSGPREPHQARVLGVSAHLDGRRVVLPAVPRSAAGPDPRAALPREAYESVTVPVVPVTAQGPA